MIYISCIINLLGEWKSFINIEHCNGVQELRAIKSEATLIVKRRALSKSLTHVPVLIPYFKVQLIEHEECPIEVLCNSLQYFNSLVYLIIHY